MSLFVDFNYIVLLLFTEKSSLLACFVCYYINRMILISYIYYLNIQKMRKFMFTFAVIGMFVFSSFTVSAASSVSNFDPSPDTHVDFSSSVEFKWNGPGESEYPFSQYMLCFKDANGASAYLCLDAGVNNYMELSLEQWHDLDDAMSNVSGDLVELEWYVQSVFRDNSSADSQELFNSEAWDISYDRSKLKDYRGSSSPDTSGDSGSDSGSDSDKNSYSKLEVLDHNEGANSISLDVSNQNLNDGDFYMAECVNQEKEESSFSDLRIVSREQPADYEEELSIQLTVGPLYPDTKYGCYAAIKTPAGENAYSVKYHSEWIYVSTSADASSAVSFDLPPAGYEDKVVTRIEQFENPFPDTDMSDLEGKAAGELYRRAVIGGFPDGEFKGDEAVNRAQAAKFLLLARYAEVDDVSGDGGFSDVLPGEWYVKFVVRAAELEIINGYPDKTFKPGAEVNTAEFLKMLSLTFELEENLAYDYSDVSKKDWFAKYAGIAKKYELFPDRNSMLKPGDKLSRNDVAVAIYQYLSNR